jgi:hypothetical protein
MHERMHKHMNACMTARTNAHMHASSTMVWYFCILRTNRYFQSQLKVRVNTLQGGPSAVWVDIFDLADRDETSRFPTNLVTNLHIEEWRSRSEALRLLVISTSMLNLIEFSEKVMGHWTCKLVHLQDLKQCFVGFVENGFKWHEWISAVPSPVLSFMFTFFFRLENEIKVILFHRYETLYWNTCSLRW